jgi:ATP adenylyltransferase
MIHNNLWAPWRIEYLKSFSEQESGRDQAQPWHKRCIFCVYFEEAEKDRENLVLWRTQRCIVLFNRFPYTGGI